MSSPGIGRIMNYEWSGTNTLKTTDNVAGGRGDWWFKTRLGFFSEQVNNNNNIMYIFLHNLEFFVKQALFPTQ